MIYGHSVRQVSECGLLEMREVTVAAPSETLREIARFFSEAADRMDDEWFSGCSHLHIGNVIQDWNKQCPGKDLIVMPAELDEGYSPPVVE